jgi:redox-sensing transcriptional repressor
VAKGVSTPVVKRLSRYYRYLGDLKDNNIARISSRELSERMGVTASQIRQDLNCFGGFGQQGYGYNVNMLYDEIGEILGLNSQYKAILVGAGNMGRAIASHMNFEKHGFRLIGIFDSKESMQGQLVSGLPVRGINTLEEFFYENKPDVAILCIPKEAVLSVADQLVSLGIKGFWNFSHYDLGVKYPNITVENVHLSDSLMTFCYHISARK